MAGRAGRPGTSRSGAAGSEGDRLAFSTDSYVNNPLFFLAVISASLAICGTANDVAVSGAIPRYLSYGFILEGLPMETLKAVTSMAETARTAGITIVTGDTKVVQRGAGHKLFIKHRWHGRNSGEYSLGRTDANRRRCIAGERYTSDHGATIPNLRERLGLDGGTGQRLRGADAAYSDAA